MYYKEEAASEEEECREPSTVSSAWFCSILVAALERVHKGV